MKYFDDAKTYDALSDPNFPKTGVFQLASKGIQELIVKIKPRNIKDIALAIALYRPGPLSSGWAFDIDKLRNSPHRYGDNKVDEELMWTGGIIVFQEQLMNVWSIVANGTMAEADTLRKLVGKKLTKDKRWKRYHKMFYDGGKKKGMPSTAVDDLWRQIQGAGMYSFNLSHAVSYAMLAYETAYYKVHHPLEFFAAQLQYDTGSRFTYFLEAADMGYAIEPANINASTDKFEITSDSIILPINFIKGVGEVATFAIISEREYNGDYKSCQDFADRVPKRKVNKRVKKALFAMGAFDSFSDYENLGIGEDEVIRIRSMKKRDLQREFVGYPLPTKKLLDAIKTSNKKKDSFTGIIEFTKNGIARTGKEYNMIIVFPNQQTFFVNGLDGLTEGDVVRVNTKKYSRSAKVEFIG